MSIWFFFSLQIRALNLASPMVQLKTYQEMEITPFPRKLWVKMLNG